MAYPSQVRVERSDGQSFLFGGQDWSLYGLTGLDAADYAVFTEDRGSGDGGIITGRRVAARTLEIKGRNRNTPDNAANRAAALAFFNPKLDYKIYITYLGRTRWIAGVVEKASCPFRNVYALQLLTVSFLCVEPYLLSVDDFGRDIAADEPRWGWPYMDNLTYKTIVSKFAYSGSVHIDYDGDAEADLRMTLSAAGKVVNPKILKGDSFVRVLHTMKEGDVIEIVTSPTPTVKLNGENILNQMDRLSRFAPLKVQPGGNDYSYEADYGDNVLHVVLHYYNHYLGV